MHPVPPDGHHSAAAAAPAATPSSAGLAAAAPGGRTLEEWLAYCEQLHPSAIALGLERVRTVAQRMQLHFSCVVIAVAGTNGKGSTCAMLEAILSEAGYKVGLYTSPHLVRFEERCRVRQQSVEARTLLPCFAQVEAARTQPTAVALTYFEFTTLAILQCLSQSALDVAILEVGLGGRLDATNIVDAHCAIITSIDLDHTALLGATRELIGAEKAGIMRAGKPAIVSDPMPPASVVNCAMQTGADLWLPARDFHLRGDRQQWSWSASDARGKRQYHSLAYPALRGANQLINAAGALAALDALRPLIAVTAQAVRSGLANVTLPGRFQIVPGEPTVVLDVAHNPHAVATLAANLEAMGFHPRTHAVFGAMADKDLSAMVEKMLPLVDSWYVCDLPTPRAATAQQLCARIEALAAAQKPLHHGQARTRPTMHDSPRLALQCALSQSSAADRIVVFGSFVTVGGALVELESHQAVLRPRAQAPSVCLSAPTTTFHVPHQ